MFVQVMRGRVRDAVGLRTQFDRWAEELAPGAEGWLGSTAGVTEDGEFVALARFESEAAARRNSERPEQGEWWAETARHFDGEVTFHDCTEVDVLGAGGSDAAGFVQVMEGTADRERLREIEAPLESRLLEARPDLLGSIEAWHGDGGFTDFAYFTTEADARAAETAPMPDDLAAAMGARQEAIGELTFLDLRDPWLSSP